MSDPVLGAIIAAFGAIVVALINNKYSITFKEKPPMARISSPRNGDTILENHISVSGTITNEPPAGIKFYVLHTRKGQGYWPQGPVNIERKNKGTEFNSENFINDDTEIVLVSAGSGGQALFEYFKKCDKEVFSREGVYHWTSIDKNKLPSDVKEWDRVNVKFRNR